MGFLLRPRWIALIAFTAVLTSTFIWLGFWQLDRLTQRREDNSAITAARNVDPVPVHDLLSTERKPCSCADYKRVTANGTYDSAHEILVRNRTVDDRPGFFVLTPLVTPQGTLLVARGWIPPSDKGARSAPDVPPPAAGEVSVQGRARLSESGSGATVQLGDYTAVTRINVDTLATTLDQPTFRGYVELVKQDPGVDKQLALIHEPPLDEGPHLSYAVQWFLFSALAVGGCALLIYRGARGKDRESGAPR